jgi:D-aminoacyl-tRNA deacylase
VRVVLQRVRRARVEVGGEEVASIGTGLLALVGIADGDGPAEARLLAGKTARLRILPAEGRPFDRALTDVTGAALLCVSQFTLLADVRRGNRPSWSAAARPEDGIPVARGLFGADMLVSLENDGPVTVVLDSAELARPRGR